MPTKFTNQEGHEFMPKFPPVTVQELIAILSKMPPNALVMVDDHSECFALQSSDFRVEMDSGVDCGWGDDFVGDFVLITTRS